MAKVYRAVLIGVGAVGDLIASAVGKLPNVQLVGGACRTESKGRTFADKHRCNWYPSHEAMLDAERPDFAIVCTPSGNHLEPALACAKRGVHVLCEKPLEITLDRSRQMIDACDRAGVLLGGLLPSRYIPPMRAVHDAARAGRFGSLAVVAGTVPWWRDDAYYAPTRWQGKLATDGGGALFNQGVHTVDLMQWVGAAAIGDAPGSPETPVAEVFAFAGVRSHDPKVLEVEDTAVVAMRFRNGAMGHVLAATSMWPGTFKRLMVAGRDGTAEVVEDEVTHWKFRAEQGGDEQVRTRFAGQSHTGGASNPMAISDENHRRNIEDFVRALETKGQPELTGREAAKAVAIIEACYESARTGKSVRVQRI